MEIKCHKFEENLAWLCTSLTKLSQLIFFSWVDLSRTKIDSHKLCIDKPVLVVTIVLKDVDVGIGTNSTKISRFCFKHSGPKITDVVLVLDIKPLAAGEQTSRWVLWRSSWSCVQWWMLTIYTSELIWMSLCLSNRYFPMRWLAKNYQA